MTSTSPGYEDFQALRRSLAPQYAALPSAQLVALMERHFGEGAAEAYDEYLEGFFDDLAGAVRRVVPAVVNTVRQVAPVVANVAGGVVQGAMTGSAAGLPGIIAGGLAGGAGRALQSYAGGPWRDVGSVLNTGLQLAGQFTPQGRMGSQIGNLVSGLPQALRSPQALLQQAPGLLGALGGPAGGAAQQLSSLFGNSAVQQAMGALQLGSLGRSSIPVGAAQTPVPISAITSLLSRLSAQALEEASQAGSDGESDLTYMMDPLGRPVGDPSSEIDRHNRLLSLLDQAREERRQAELQALLLAQQHQLAQWASQAATSRRMGRAQPAFVEADWGEDLGEDFEEALEEVGALDGEGWFEAEEASDDFLHEAEDWDGGWAQSREFDHARA